ncbi:MAG: hypothetical protein CMF61_00410 [Magnetococcales bacterium]|nr:hypothetical protein [Magnetococcales bacterium]
MKSNCTMSKLKKNDSVVFDIQPCNVKAHNAWNEALAKQHKKFLAKRHEDENLKDILEVFENCRNQDKAS